MPVSWIVAIVFALPALFIDNVAAKAVVLTICGCIAVFGPMIDKSNGGD